MATVQLRCEGNLYGVYDPELETLEVRCKRRKHGAQPGVVVIHQISLKTGQVIKTARFKDPATIGKEGS